MAGLFVELIINWVLLWILYKKNLFALGISPSGSRLANLFIGFIMAAACCALYFLSFTAFANSTWSLNKEISTKTLAASSWWTLNSVLFEELIFRGALLYIAIKKLGAKAACLISAVSFGVYHWFSMGAWGNPMQMIFLFFMTGIWGFMFAMAFAKTKSLYLPIGLHFGWNLVSTVVFSQGPLGNQLLIHTYGQQLGGFLSIVVFLFQVFAVPALAWLYLLKRYSLKQQVQTGNHIV